MQVESKYAGTTSKGFRTYVVGKRKGDELYGPKRKATVYERKTVVPYAPKPKSAYLDRQIKALIAGKRKDAADVVRTTADQKATTVSCLTSTTDFSTAASGTGLLDHDGDECLINGVKISQTLTSYCIEDVTPVGLTDALVRTIIVYFKKPLLVASAAGTLPPVTEVLVSDSVASLVVPPTQNAGRFVVLYDKTDNLHQNSVAVAATGAYPRNNGANRISRQFYVKIDKKVHYKVAAVSGTPAGHYDSDVDPGQVDAGLICMYTLVSGYSSGQLNLTNTTRLNYTG